MPLDDRTQLDDVVEWVEKFNVSTEKARSVERSRIKIRSKTQREYCSSRRATVHVVDQGTKRKPVY